MVGGLLDEKELPPIASQVTQKGEQPCNHERRPAGGKSQTEWTDVGKSRTEYDFNQKRKKEKTLRVANDCSAPGEYLDPDWPGIQRGGARHSPQGRPGDPSALPDRV